MSDLSLALTLLGASLSAALAYLPMTVRAPSILRSVFKTVPVALLAVIAWWQGALGSWSRPLWPAPWAIWHCRVTEKSRFSPE